MSSKARRLFERGFTLQIVRQLASSEKQVGQIRRERQLPESLGRGRREPGRRRAWLDRSRRIQGVGCAAADRKGARRPGEAERLLCSLKCEGAHLCTRCWRIRSHRYAASLRWCIMRTAHIRR
jgi:hypothetical protein